MIPRSSDAIKDIIVAGVFIAFAVLFPGPTLISGNSDLRGIALGIGLGWLVKSIIDHKKGVKSEA